MAPQGEGSVVVAAVLEQGFFNSSYRVDGGNSSYRVMDAAPFRALLGHTCAARRSVVMAVGDPTDPCIPPPPSPCCAPHPRAPPPPPRTGESPSPCTGDGANSSPPKVMRRPSAVSPGEPGGLLPS